MINTEKEQTYIKNKINYWIKKISSLIVLKIELLWM